MLFEFPYLLSGHLQYANTGFGSSVIDFNPALSAGTTEISLDFSITGEIITADTVTLHLAEFGGEAFTQDPLSGQTSLRTCSRLICHAFACSLVRRFTHSICCVCLKNAIKRKHIIQLGVDGADWEGTYTPSSLPPTIVLTYTGTTTISSGTIVNLVIDRTEQLRIREREVFADDDTIMISSNAASLGSEGTTPHGIHAITACRTVPIARHVTFTGEKGIDLIVTLSPYDAEPTNTLVCSIPSVPMYGQLYQVKPPSHV